ncbi:hypothetical protein RUMGNA_00098 [Mediterraneibacter gnavus ATCC 29149]|uniref:Uncharacterized protein n=1 Tax=Mediterraneibacter gnavus (strain ATCC 29149 / DSM 114966 / JCM 6515 / VPI C7-9) TaxID=411470 RepID=A7AXT5_MEDG7|nr:hypothetical protein RUMGNA_00098 [Mediterraneibacter gnavus ATCC 29149]
MCRVSSDRAACSNATLDFQERYGGLATYRISVTSFALLSYFYGVRRNKIFE